MYAQNRTSLFRSKSNSYLTVWAHSILIYIKKQVINRKNECSSNVGAKYTNLHPYYYRIKTNQLCYGLEFIAFHMLQIVYSSVVY